MSRKRALIAAVLATVYPGLGHVYLRTWFRAFTWFALSLLTAAVVVPESVVTAYESGGLSAVVEASRSLPMEAFLAILAIRALNVIDATWIGLQPKHTPREAEGPTCPNCSREIDDDLDFCHWCTTRVDAGAEEARADGGLF